MITVHTEFHSHFKELTATGRDSFELDQPLVAELAERISAKYGEKMRAILIDPDTQELNERGTMLVDTKGRRICMEDSLADGDNRARNFEPHDGRCARRWRVGTGSLRDIGPIHAGEVDFDQHIVFAKFWQWPRGDVHDIGGAGGGNGDVFHGVG